MAQIRMPSHPLASVLALIYASLYHGCSRPVSAASVHYPHVALRDTSVAQSESADDVVGALGLHSLLEACRDAAAATAAMATTNEDLDVGPSLSAAEAPEVCVLSLIDRVEGRLKTEWAQEYGSSSGTHRAAPCHAAHHASPDHTAPHHAYSSPHARSPISCLPRYRRASTYLGTGASQ